MLYLYSSTYTKMVYHKLVILAEPGPSGEAMDTVCKAYRNKQRIKDRMDVYSIRKPTIRRPCKVCFGLVSTKRG